MKNKTGITLAFLMLFCTFFFCNVFAITLDELYDVKPEPSSCKEGALMKSEKLKVLDRLNAIRKLHGLKPVSYNEADDALTAKSALIMQANTTLTHTPDKTMKCWSAEGEKGSGKSNIHIYYSSGMKSLEDSEDIIAGWLIDDGVDSLGHRRWLIDPFLKHVSFGRVDGKPVINSEWEISTGAAISVINDEDADIKDTKIEFVAYPYQNYSNELFKKNWFLSFTALYDKKSSWNNSDAKYANAKITVTDENGSALSVHSASHDNTGFGVPNIIQWKVNGLQDNVKYTVKISGVMVEGKPKEYTYWFTLTDATPEKLVAMDTINGTENTPKEPTISTGTESKLTDCSALFQAGTTITFYAATQEKDISDKVQIKIVKNKYIEFSVVDFKGDTIPLYAAINGRELTLISPPTQFVINGTCYTDGVYGKSDETYFYLGQRNTITLQDIQAQIKNLK